MTKLNTYNLQLDNNYTVSYKDIAGSKFIVAPVVMMREGVHSGSGGAIYHSPEGLKSSVEDWEGKPTISYHPFNGKDYVGVSEYTPAQGDITGTILNVNFDEEANSLNAQAWLSIKTLEDKDPNLLEALKTGTPVNVSVGVYSDDEEVKGEWNGESYDTITKGYTPDHLAILLNEDGACSLEDGCGIRDYSEHSPTFIFEMTKGENKKEIKVNKEYKEFIKQIDSVVYGMHENAYTWIAEVYDDFFVYEYDPHGSEPLVYYRQTYAYSETDGVSLVGEPIEVVKNITYEIKANKDVKPEDKQVKTNTQTGGDLMSCTCDKDKASKVDELIKANADYSEADKEMLEGLDEKVLDTLLSKSDTAIIVNNAVTEEPDTQASTTSEVVVTKEQVLNALGEMTQQEKYDAVLGDKDKKVIARGLQAYEKTKEILVNRLKDKQTVYSEEELQNLELDDLEKTAKLVGIDTEENIVAYLGNAGVSSTVDTGSGEGDTRPAMMIPTDKNKDTKGDK